MNRTQWIIGVSIAVLMVISGIFLGSLYTERSGAVSTKSDDGVVGAKHTIDIPTKNDIYTLDLSGARSDLWAIGIHRSKPENVGKLELASVTWQDDEMFGKVPATIQGISPGLFRVDDSTAGLLNASSFAGYSDSLAGYITLSHNTALSVKVNGSEYHVKPSRQDQMLVNGETIEKDIPGMHVVLGQLSNIQLQRNVEIKGDVLTTTR